MPAHSFTMPNLRRAALLCGAVIALVACGQVVTRRLVTPDQGPTLDRKSPFLKAHLRNGYVYVLQEWSWNDSSRSVSGRGTLFDADRHAVGQLTDVKLPRDSVALFETNVSHMSGSSVALAVMTGVTAAIAVGCALNPKACFGSCPTFYAPRFYRRAACCRPRASRRASRPRSRRTDLDALYRARPTRPRLRAHADERGARDARRFSTPICSSCRAHRAVASFATPERRFRRATSLDRADAVHAPPKAIAAPRVARVRRSRAIRSRRRLSTTSARARRSTSSSIVRRLAHSVSS